MRETVSRHYGEDYFRYQYPLGEFGGWANKTKFEKYISADSDVLDFGCGGGFLLKELNCRRKIGVEPNEKARIVAAKNGIEVFTKIEDVPNECVNVIISNNVLEHCLLPLEDLKELYLKLKKNGKIIFVVSCESISLRYKPADINHHLYSWSPMDIGNLFDEAGFRVIESKPYIHKWPPYHKTIAKIGGRMLFEILCRIYGRFERSWFQVRIIGIKSAQYY